MFQHIIKYWLPLAIASIIIVFSVYAIIQQDIRTSANDPQIQLAEDGAIAMAQGMQPSMLIGSAHIDMEQSLAPFVIVYDETGKVLSSSGFLNGQVPVLPNGVFDYTRKVVDDRITWQPASTTRIAAIIKHFQGTTTGFIASGRNMREVEIRESQLELMLGAALLGLLLLTLVVTLYSWFQERSDL